MNYVGLITSQEGGRDLIQICDHVKELSAKGCGFRARLFALSVVVIEPSRVLVHSIGDIFKFVATKTQDLYLRLKLNQSFFERAVILTDFVIKSPIVVVAVFCALYRVVSVLIYHLGQTIFCPSEMRTFEDEYQIYAERDKKNKPKEIKPTVLEKMLQKDPERTLKTLKLLSIFGINFK
ncbi:MAG: hypothetical protein EB053_03825 [Chlamydiae bacterium]|nr:hypothetical protein [Chlamydiota bacterium]